MCDLSDLTVRQIPYGVVGGRQIPSLARTGPCFIPVDTNQTVGSYSAGYSTIESGPPAVDHDVEPAVRACVSHTATPSNPSFSLCRQQTGICQRFPSSRNLGP